MDNCCLNLETLQLKKADLSEEEHLVLFQKLLLEDNEFAGFIKPLFLKGVIQQESDIYSSYYIVYDDLNAIGYIYLSNIDLMNRVSLLYVIESSFRGKKYGKRLLREVSQFLFNNDNNIHEIELYIEGNNRYSKKAAVDAGFQKEGLFHYRINREILFNSQKINR